jgi:hypothetical protein
MTPSAVLAARSDASMPSYTANGDTVAAVYCGGDAEAW